MSDTFHELAMKTALKAGATEALTRFTCGSDYQIRFSNSNVDISNAWEINLLEVFLAIGRKTTQVDINDPTKEKIVETITQAINFTKKMPNSQFYAGIESEKHTYAPLHGLFDQRIETFYERAPDLVNVAIDASLEAGAKRVAGVLYYGRFHTDLLTSYGATGNYDSSYYRLTIRSFVDNESSGQDVLVGREMSDLEKKFTSSGEYAGNIAKMAIGGKQGKAGKYDLIMSPTVAGNVLGQITDGANPLMILIGMSPISDHMGEQIGPENFSVSDDPHISEGLGSKAFDVEGTPTFKKPIIQNGALVGIIHNTTSGKLMQTKSTGNSELVNFTSGSKILAPAPTNMVYSMGDSSFDDIVEDSKKPTLYVTSNWYTRYTNMLEGEFSTIPRDGMFLIEHGEIKKPLRKLRLTDNLLRMSENIETIGNDRKQIFWWEVVTPTFIPTIKVKDCNITAATK